MTKQHNKSSNNKTNINTMGNIQKQTATKKHNTKHTRNVTAHNKKQQKQNTHNKHGHNTNKTTRNTTQHETHKNTDT